MIRFPHLGIELSHVGRYVTVFGFEVAYYGIVIAAAMLAGVYLVTWIAKKTGQNPDDYFTFALIAIVCSILGARIYYVIFSWDYYSAHPAEIFNLRGGGLAIYGGVIAGILTGIVFSRIRKIKPLLLLDTACIGLILGQSIGRWGNFFNREAFGEYTDTLLAMQLPEKAVYASDITPLMREHLVQINGISFIQVHPTFLYESLWNLGVLTILLIVTLRGRKRFDGQVFFLYLLGYGLGRGWIEGQRTDQLLIPGTSLPVSQLLSWILAAGSAVVLAVLSQRAGRAHTETER